MPGTDEIRLDALFREAVGAIDAGNTAELERMLAAHPVLLGARLDRPGAWLRDKVAEALDGFFARPYLLWFVAEDPVRNNTLPANIAQIARILIEAARRAGVDTLQEQLDYTLRLVAWSGVAREAGVQIGLIDGLVDAGASLDGSPDAALVNGHWDAAAHLLERGAPLTLAAAASLEMWDALPALAQTTNARQRQMAFVQAALNGNAEALRRLLALGADVNAPSEDLYAHGTPLHHAVWSGSLDAVRVLVDAGARLDARDQAHAGTPLDWAEYGKRDEVAAWLRAQGG